MEDVGTSWSLICTYIRFLDGRVKTVSIRDLAPAPKQEINVSTGSSIFYDEDGGLRDDFDI